MFGGHTLGDRAPMNFFTRTATLAVPLCAWLACSGGIGATDAAKQVSNAYCEKVKTCVGDATFAASYPAGITGCVDKGLSALPADAKDKNSPCGQPEIDTCIKDIQATTCPADNAVPDLAASCNKC